MLGLVLVLIANFAYADREHHNTNIVYETQTVVEKETVINYDESFKQGLAEANAAAAHQFNYGVYKWQGSFALGEYDSVIAPSLGAAIRHEEFLFNFSIREHSKNAAVNWTF